MCLCIISSSVKNPGAPEVDVSDSEQPPDFEMDCRDMLSTKRFLAFWVKMLIVFLIFFSIFLCVEVTF